MSACEVAILARAPQPGRAKTRLIGRLGADGAAELQRRLIAQALARAAASGLPIALWLDGAADAALSEAVARAGAALRPQPDGDLGARMLAAAHHAQRAGRSVILIGTDCPAQTPQDLQRAQSLLATHEVVLQPAEDGGYVLIALRAPQPALFDGIAWGSAEVLAATRARIVAANLSLAELRLLPDLDRPDDLDRALAAGWIATCG
jgi:rSAM/selenodomain-associated transferase 1